MTFLLLLGIAALDMFYLWFRLGSIFDYMAFGVPVFKSGIIGFDNFRFILNQRLLFFFLGSALVLATVLLFKRLPQSKFHRILTITFLVIFTAAAGVCAFNTYSVYISGINVKKQVIEANKQFENKNFATVIHSSIDLSHSGESIKATSEIIIRNDISEPLDHYIFSLNPSLRVLKVSHSGVDLKFTRINHIIDIEPSEKLNAGMTDTVLIAYEGGINEAFCYPDFSDKINENPYRIAMVNVNKRQAFLQPDYVLLTPETHWYPVTALNFYPSNPARIKIDFTEFSLKVKEEKNLTVVSQGSMKSIDGFSIFSSENPMTGITLAIGNYRSDTLKVDSVQYISYYFPGNDYYKKDLAELKDTLTFLVSGIMRELETNFSTKYPFKNLSLVEVPVQFHSYPRQCTQTRSEVQPSMVLLPEKFSTLQNAGFYKQFKNQKKRMARNNQVITDKELQVRLFNSFIRNTFISGENFRYTNGVALNEPTRYRLGPSFYFFKNNFHSSNYPVINAIFESHLQQVTQTTPRGGFQAMVGSLSETDKANLILKKTSFNDLLKKNPSGDTVRIVLSVKGDWFFNLLRSRAGINEFNTWFSKYLDNHKFKSIDILQFNNDVKNKFGFEFYPLMNEWFYGSKMPGFRFENLNINEIVIGDRSRYQVTFVASNPEPVTGVFNVSFRGGGTGMERGSGQPIFQGGGREGITVGIQGRGMEPSDISKIVFLNPAEAKKIGIILDYKPRAMLINTLFAKNIPGQINMPVDEIIKTNGGARPFDGEELLPKLQGFKNRSEIIVDNEDSGFISKGQVNTSRLKKILGIDGNKGDSYQRVRAFNFPEYWQPVVETYYYGDYVRSSVYTRAGTGDRQITWETIIKEPGYYDVYCYVGKAIRKDDA